MISKIRKINNLGLLFSNYAWETTLPALKAFNIFYGWNGSGKTTLSRLFDAVSGISIPNLEYELEDEQGNRYRQGDPFPDKIRVFNQGYIQRNVEILKGRANSISILLGAENKDLLKAIDQDKKLLEGDPSSPKFPGKAAQLIACTKEKQQKVIERGRYFTDIAKTIGAAIGGNALRDYRKQQAEKDFESLSAKKELSEEDLKKALQSVKQDSLPALQLTTLPIIKGEGAETVDIPTLLKSAHGRAETLLLRTVESELIARLSTNADISQWVEQGIDLHKRHSSELCEYCGQAIPSDRVKLLTLHFNEADSQLKEDLDSLTQQLELVHQAIESLAPADTARLYTDLRPSYDAARAAFDSTRQDVLQSIQNCVDEMHRKKARTTQAVVLKAELGTDDLVRCVDHLNNVISVHNQTTRDFDEVKENAVRTLKNYYLSTIADEIGELDERIRDLDQNAEALRTEVGEIQKRIARNMASVSSEHKACENLNEKLATFLGRQELRFIPRVQQKQTESGVSEDVVSGYDIMRGNEPALSLSEGEKSAVAFVYFIVHLGDRDFNVHDGIVLIDDPVSSLDSNSLYQAFSFLKNAVKDCKQVFIFTHNFDFLKLLINWRRRGGGAGYYMVKNCFAGDVRCAYIDKMDKELCEYESEYHYLYKLLRKSQDEQDGTIAKAYPVPNIARKVWDTFLTFRVPNGENPYKKMDDLKKAGFDAQKLDAIYKFTNDQSHITGSGFDPALVPETKKVLGEMFEMMEKISPKHYAILSNSITT
jgi:wobble nucleotide-excising tRNase